MSSVDSKNSSQKGGWIAYVADMSEKGWSRQASEESICDPATEHSIKRKCDLHILPWAFLLWMFAFIDRSNITNAYYSGLQEAINMNGTRLNVALVMFHIFFILVSIPSNLLLKKFGGGSYLAVAAGAWGLLVTCMGTIQSYGALLACRLLLGLFEGCFFGGLLVYMGMFYKRDELVFRFGIFISAASLSGAFGAMLAAGLAQLHYAGYIGWPWIFFTEGPITIVLAIGAFLSLPNTPSSAKFLTEDERKVAVHRLYLDVQKTTTVERVEQEKINWPTVRFAIMNVNTLLMSFIAFLIIIPIYSFGIFLPLIIGGLSPADATFGDRIKAQALAVPPNFVAFLSVLAVTYISDRLKMRGPLIIPSLLVAAVGYIMQLASSSIPVQYTGIFFIAIGAFPCSALIYAWLSNNLAPHYSRATGLGFAGMISQCGAVVATFTYLDRDKPAYTIGHSINLGAITLCTIVVAINVLYIKRENAARKAGKRDDRYQQVRDGQELGYRHPAFRYKL